MPITKDDVFVNPNTGLVAVKYLGQIDVEASGDPDKQTRVGHAGAGRRVGEIRGEPAEIAVRMVNDGVAELIPAADVKRAIAADAAGAAAAEKASNKAKAAALKAADADGSDKA